MPEATRPRNATDVQIDLSDRGGCVTMSRRFSPLCTCISSWTIASMCQLCRYRSPGETVWNTLAMKVPRSCRKAALNSAW